MTDTQLTNYAAYKRDVLVGKHDAKELPALLAQHGLSPSEDQMLNLFFVQYYSRRSNLLSQQAQLRTLLDGMEDAGTPEASLKKMTARLAEIPDADSFDKQFAVHYGERGTALLAQHWPEYQPLFALMNAKK